MENNKILVTGAAGFIGYHLCKHLVQLGKQVIGLDNLNDYYDITLKRDRLHQLGIESNLDISYNKLYTAKEKSCFQFIQLDISDRENLPLLFEAHQINLVVNLAAQAGVRYSIDAPFSYVDSNLVGFSNVLECCRNYKIEKLVYASSSSVYGDDPDLPFDEQSKKIKPKSFYAVTKRANELMAQCYSDLYDIETIGLRFFTVYGPWGRPDMAPILFANAILENQVIKVFNQGNLSRDFTFIDDIVNGIISTFSAVTKTKHTLLNIGCGSPVNLLDFITLMEEALGKKAKKELVEMQAGDVYKTWADISQLNEITGYTPKVNLKKGIIEFIDWYLSYKKNTV